MDNLVQTLQRLAETDDPLIDWEVSNNGVVIRVTVTSKKTFDTPNDAMAGAVRIVRELTADDGHLLVNRAELGATIDPFGEEPVGWRGTVDVCLWPSDQLGESHRVIELP